MIDHVSQPGYTISLRTLAVNHVVDPTLWLGKAQVPKKMQAVILRSVSTLADQPYWPT